MPKTNYTSPNNIYRAMPADTDGMFTVYNISTNLKIGVLDAEQGKIKFTDADSCISTYGLRDLCNLIDALYVKYGD